MENFDRYTQFLKDRAIPDYKETKGFVGLSFLKRIKNNEGHFTLITYWKNLEIIENFVGEDFEKAKYYPEDKDFLLEFEDHVEHYSVFA